MSYNQPSIGLSISKIVAIAVTIIFGLFVLVNIGRISESVGADEIVVIQSPVAGKLTWHMTPGIKWQGLGSVTTYKKRSIYEFEAPVQFNDGGKGVIFGSVQYDLPLNVENLNALHTRFGSMEAIQQQVMEVVTNKVIYMTGPVMSSRESYAEKRNYLILYAQDQIDEGVYQTRNAVRVDKDQFTNQERVVTYAEIVMGADGRPARQEQSVVGEFGIRAFNFSIEKIVYDETVENQIKQQQQITMDVQTSVAEALKAQQSAITAEQQGRAAAAQAKWEQEVIKAKAVTEAESKLAVMTLSNQEAEQYRQATLKRADADSTARKQMMAADGALNQKLQAYVQVQQLWANAMAATKSNLVPNTVMGGGSANGNGAINFMDIMTAKAAKDLALEPVTGR